MADQRFAGHCSGRRRDCLLFCVMQAEQAAVVEAAVFYELCDTSTQKSLERMFGKLSHVLTPHEFHALMVLQPDISYRNWLRKR